MASVERLRMAPMARELSPPAESSRQEVLYQEVAASFGPALDRLSRAYQADGERRRDLLQEIHVAVWRSLAIFDGRCSLLTWVYRVAHNVGASHVLGDRRARSKGFVTLVELETVPGPDDVEAEAERREAIERLLHLIQRLNPVDRQVILLFLEGVDPAGIAEIAGLTTANVATKIHRIKAVLARRFQGGGRHE